MPRNRDDREFAEMLGGPHQRHNPLLDEWVTVSPQRTRRPWLGAREPAPPAPPPAYDPSCYLCPGNERAGGRRNPPYQGSWSFDNDFPALLAGGPPAVRTEETPTARFLLFEARPAFGVCRVVCFSPRHDLHLAALPLSAVEQVVRVWTDEYQELLSRPGIGHVQIFENRGSLMGASNPHPHSQIWADRVSPTIPRREQRSLARWAGECLLCDYLEAEVEDGRRLVFVEGETVCLVPFWATWPFEVMLLPRPHRRSLAELESDGRRDWARAMQRLVAGYDRLFDVPFPYSMGIHQLPREATPFHLHAHYQPPLLRSASVRKFMVGYEMLAQAQRDLTPEAAAERLREVAA
ncbi:MAG: galactose-1-phosphate uridylyltransferase [Candidatus Dormibacteraceae bacterium]